MSSKPYPALSMERAIAHFMLMESSLLEMYWPAMDLAMFEEPLTGTMLRIAFDLDGDRSRASLITVCKAEGIPNAAEHFALLASSMTPGAVFDSLYARWLSHARRRFISTKQAEAEASTSSADEYATQMQSIFDAAAQLGGLSDGVSLKTSALKALENTEQIAQLGPDAFVSTLSPRLDTETAGIMKGIFCVLAARPSVGKTSFACQVALNEVSKGKRVLFNSLEMSPEQLAVKFAGIHCSLNTHLFYRPDLFTKVTLRQVSRAISAIAPLDIRITQYDSVAKLDAAVARLAPDIVIHDFIQILNAPAEYRGNQVAFLGDFARGLERLSKKHNRPSVLGLSQIRRGGGEDMDSIKGSGAIEEAADMVMLLQWPEADADSPEALRRRLFIAKARYGLARVYSDFLFHPSYQRFESWSDSRAESIWNDLHTVTVP